MIDHLACIDVTNVCIIVGEGSHAIVHKVYECVCDLCVCPTEVSLCAQRSIC